MKLSEAVDAYHQLRVAKKAAGTVRCEHGELMGFVRHVGDMNTQRLTAAHVEDYFYGPQGRNSRVSGPTFNNTRARVKGFLDWAQHEGLVRGNLIYNVDRAKVYEKNRKRLTGAQMAEAIETLVHPRDRIAIAIACNTGIRVSSVEELRKKDIDLDAGVIRYVNVKLRRERELPITADLDRELRRWFKWYEDCCGPLQPDWFLVPARPRGGGRWEELTPDINGQGHGPVVPTKAAAMIRRIAHRALVGVGMDEKGEGMHTFRRSAGRAVFETAVTQGDPRAIYLAQSFLDHANPEQTMVYIGRNLEQQKVNDLLRGKSFLTTPVEDSQEDGSNVIQGNFGRARNA